MFSFLKRKSINIYNPCKGRIIDIEKVPDPVFSSKMLGDGVAVTDIQGDIYAPISGVIKCLYFPTAHAFCIVSDEGLELLVHIGFNTVNINKGFFRPLKQEGDYIKVGDKIIEINKEYYKYNNMGLNYSDSYFKYITIYNRKIVLW